MKFVISVIDNLSNSGTPDEMKAIDAFNDKLRADGNWFFACGLEAPSTATVIDNRAGARLATGKPLFDAPENVSGFWIIEAADHETASRLAYEGSMACNRKVELRKLHG